MICKKCGKDKPLFSFQKVSQDRFLKKSRQWKTYVHRRRECFDCNNAAHRLRRAEKKLGERIN